ncbi:methyltransferase-like protein 22 [Cyprinodon tularosa]|uniref:methyltransferase-like protein 22 n=1 Tax=Cyprinodon tularosa TaxID=77115 RepID=UPI0018E23901|nr:methyltransferase-like protein 22 [Cyprinodon tularosa]XP_038154324.1 methyltransferase-like protein 22 [Cyprinodon tularosa]XP_038154325.1 methyltransferase-like protein 22 [Cyprinodon tularosa]XP_038154326.1 methyltransferase-like protein 22 [Cyprinodon tularosa]XP_038154327.1 methyltransferase-like protein 22 [Cyprinodon tularosa]
MDQITFQHDTVLSDVHMHRPNTRHLMTRLSAVGQPVFMSRFRILAEVRDEGGCEDKLRSPRSDDDDDDDEEGYGDEEPLLDEDGDLDVAHRPRKDSVDDGGRDLVCPIILQQSDPEQHDGDDEDDEDAHFSKDIIRIEHTMATPLQDVGKQVWRGALLLADFILSEPDLFRGATVLELGAGTGLTSIVTATMAKTVYCTDVGEDLLRLCNRNVCLNKHILEPAGGKVKVKRLDWLQHSLCTDADGEFSWTEEEVADLYDNASFILAADVCYDDDLTDGLFRTLYRLCSSFRHAAAIFISLEKRMNFSLRHMDVCCEAYNHFMHCLSQLQDLQDGRWRFMVELVPLNFPQFLLYERIEQLELWKITASLLPSERSRLDSNGGCSQNQPPSRFDPTTE